jgi:hypothetical protein
MKNKKGIIQIAALRLRSLSFPPARETTFGGASDRRGNLKCPNKNYLE